LLAAWKRDLRLPDGAVRLIEGNPADAIVEAANGSDVDLLVMGTHGLTGFQKLFLGSVTEKVLHRVRVPLLVLSSKDVAAKGVAFEVPRTILLAVDFGPESQSVTRHGVWLAEHYGARLVAAHGVPVPYVVLNDRTIERLTPQQLAELEEGLVRERREKLESLLPEGTGVELQSVVRIGSAFETLHELVRERGVDLVVMGAGAHGETGLGWLGSTCHKMVRAGGCPVLVVR
jgi:nucleotide-binding universal stress UspA family protein